MEVSNLPLSPTLPPPGQKASKKQAKLMRQRLEKMERINIHLHGEKNTSIHAKYNKAEESYSPFKGILRRILYVSALNSLTYF